MCPVKSSLRLPPRLTLLRLNHLAITSFLWFNGLPATLTTLDVEISHAPNPLDIGLQRSPITFPSSLTDLSILCYTPITGIAHIMRVLPPKLVHLKLSFDSRERFSNDCVPLLP